MLGDDSVKASLCRSTLYKVKLYSLTRTFSLLTKKLEPLVRLDYAELSHLFYVSSIIQPTWSDSRGSSVFSLVPSPEFGFPSKKLDI